MSELCECVEDDLQTSHQNVFNIFKIGIYVNCDKHLINIEC